MMAKKNNYLTTAYDESIRTLRTNILFSNVDKDIKKIVVTSSVPNEGKTTLCIDLARSMASNGSKVALIDLDLRNPSVKNMTSQENNIGVTTVIMKKATLSDASTKDTEQENLDIISSGPIPPNPTELIASDSMKSILDKLTINYDYIIIDTPPVGILTDAAIISTLADGVLLVIKAGSTKKEMVKKAIDNIEKVNGNILGAIMTFVNVKNSQYGNYYGSYY